MNPGHPLPAELSSARVARRLAEEELCASGFRGDVAAVVLLVSELVTNAVLHAQPPIELSVGATAGAATVEVRDGDARPLPGAIPASSAPTIGGYGLRIVADVADEWGCVTSGAENGGGKVVWFTVGRTDEEHL